MSFKRSTRRKRSLRRRRSKAEQKKRTQKLVRKENKTKTMTISDNKLGWRKEVHTKNLNKFLLQAYKRGIDTLIVNNYPEKNDIFNVSKEVKKRKLKY